MRLWHFSSSVNSSSTGHAQQSSGAGCLIFGQTLRLLPYFMCANSEGSDETARIMVIIEKSMLMNFEMLNPSNHRMEFNEILYASFS